MKRKMKTREEFFTDFPQEIRIILDDGQQIATGTLRQRQNPGTASLCWFAQLNSVKVWDNAKQTYVVCNAQCFLRVMGSKVLPSMIGETTAEDIASAEVVEDGSGS